MSDKEDSEIEQIIPISLQVEENVDSQDDESDQSETHQFDMDANQYKGGGSHMYPNGHQGQFAQTWGSTENNDGRSYSGQYGWYSQLPPTINIFACPPPPPSHCGFHGCHQVFRPRAFAESPRIQVPNQGFTINMPPNILFPQDYSKNQDQSHIPGKQTPPPPNLTTPFNCEDIKPSRCAPTLLRNTATNNSRYHPYQTDSAPNGIKKEHDLSVDNRSFLCVDTQDFNASEISIKVKDKTLTIEGRKAQNNNTGRFLGMKHEFTFKSKDDAKSTSCTYHSNGTLVLQFRDISDKQRRVSESDKISK